MYVQRANLHDVSTRIEKQRRTNEKHPKEKKSAQYARNSNTSPEYTSFAYLKNLQIVSYQTIRWVLLFASFF